MRKNNFFEKELDKEINDQIRMGLNDKTQYEIMQKVSFTNESLNQIRHFKNKLETLGVSTSILIDYGKGHAIPQNSSHLNILYTFFKTHLNPPIITKQGHF